MEIRNNITNEVIYLDYNSHFIANVGDVIFISGKKWWVVRREWYCGTKALASLTAYVEEMN